MDIENKSKTFNVDQTNLSGNGKNPRLFRLLADKVERERYHTENVNVRILDICENNNVLYFRPSEKCEIIKSVIF